MSLTNQSTFITVDEFGPDPLSDESYDAILAVKSSTPYTITAPEQFNPALTSFENYRTGVWWRAILIYNNIDDVWDYKEGMKIRIPDVNEMTTRLQRVLSAQRRATVTI